MLSGIALTACSDDTFGPDPEKDWAGTTNVVVSSDEQGFSTYYTPALGRVGDPMPFYDKKAGNFKVMYLQEYEKNPSFRFHPIWAVETNDGASYKQLSEWLPVGNIDTEQDAALGTGSCYYNETDGLYYIYYTGHNGSLGIQEAVMRATSPDLKTWTKDKLWTLYGKDNGHSSVDFRDPQIFEEGGKYHMIISTRPANGGDPYFAVYDSENMKDWTYSERVNMLWDRMYECPDVFQMGNWWYLVFSDATKTNWARCTKYVKAESWAKLKSIFNNAGDLDREQKPLDSRGFYAGKTAGNDNDRYIWGWCPFRSGNTIYEKNVNTGGGDGKEPNWSGSLVCHKVQQNADGSLTLVEVPAIKVKYSISAEVKVVKSNGTQDNKTLTGDDAYIQFNRLGTHNHISFTVTTSNNWDKFGVSFVQGDKTVLNPKDYLNEQGEPDFGLVPEDVLAKIQRSYTIVCNPENENWRKFNFEEEGFFKFGEETHNVGKGFIEGIDSYGFDRPADNTYKFDIYTDNSVLVMYVNNKVCYTNRIYGIQKNCWSINNYGGTVTVSDVKVSQY